MVVIMCFRTCFRNRVFNRKSYFLNLRYNFQARMNPSAKPAPVDMIDESEKPLFFFGSGLRNNSLHRLLICMLSLLISDRITSLRSLISCNVLYFSILFMFVALKIYSNSRLVINLISGLSIQLFLKVRNKINIMM